MTENEAFVIYLLHFDQPVSHALHYLGSTTPTNFDKRMRAHANGYGSNLTTRVFKTGIPISIAYMWLTPSRELERKLKNNGHFKRICPVCSPERFPNVNKNPIVITDAQVHRPDWLPIAWNGNQ